MALRCATFEQAVIPMPKRSQHLIGAPNAVIRVYEDAGNVIATHEHAGDFVKPPPRLAIFIR